MTCVIGGRTASNFKIILRKKIGQSFYRFISAGYTILIILFRYSDLLALAEDFEDMKSMPTRTLRGLPCRRASAASGMANQNITLSNQKGANNKHKKAQDSNSSDESSEVKPIYIQHRKYGFYVSLLILQPLLILSSTVIVINCQQYKSVCIKVALSCSSKKISKI